jgi:hypothetical protein
LIGAYLTLFSSCTTLLKFKVTRGYIYYLAAIEYDNFIINPHRMFLIIHTLCDSNGILKIKDLHTEIVLLTFYIEIYIFWPCYCDIF